jgi:hypothetical protein
VKEAQLDVIERALARIMHQGGHFRTPGDRARVDDPTGWIV